MYNLVVLFSAMVLYAMVTGHSPWSDERLEPLQVMLKVAIKQERPAIPSHVRADLRVLIETCWQHDPSLRHSAAVALELLNTFGATPEAELKGTTSLRD